VHNVRNSVLIAQDADLIESIPMPRWGKKSTAPPPAPVSFVLIRITSHPGKYAALSRKGDLVVSSKAQASEFPANEAPLRQKFEADQNMWSPR
jgi:hypothetical protein